MKITDVTRIDDISSKDFRENFLKPELPIITQNFAKNWPAIEKWSLDYLAEKCGHIDVPLYKETFAESGDYMKAQKSTSFRDYLKLLSTTNEQYRMFLFNIAKKMPGLRKDFTFSDFSKHYIKSKPFLFFGNKGCHVDAHYDADMSHVFITQFLGQKTITLFKPEYSKMLYRHPLTVSTNVDIGNPNFSKYPLLKNITGYRCILNHGDTLFMPSGWWHYVHYDELSFSLSLRAMSPQWRRRLQGAINIAKLLVADRALTKLIGSKRWYDSKERWAHWRTRGLSLAEY